MALEPLGSVMTMQAQPAVKQTQERPSVEYKEISTPEQAAVIDPRILAVKNAGEKGSDTSAEQQQQNASNEQIKKVAEAMNRNMSEHSEAVFGIHEATKRVTIKIVDKTTKELIKEFPPEKTLDMIAKAWELAGLMVDERR